MISICHLIIISLAFLTSFLNDLFITRYIGKNGKTNLRDWLSTWAYQKQPPWSLSQSKCRTIRTARLLVGWRHYFNHSHQIVLLRCSLSPKWQFWTAAILDCIIGIYGNHENHAMILGTELNLTNFTSPLRFRVAPSCSSKTCIDDIKSSPSLRPFGEVNSWKGPRPCQT